MAAAPTETPERRAEPTRNSALGSRCPRGGDAARAWGGAAKAWRDEGGQSALRVAGEAGLPFPRGGRGRGGGGVSWGAGGGGVTHVCWRRRRVPSAAALLWPLVCPSLGQGLQVTAGLRRPDAAERRGQRAGGPPAPETTAAPALSLLPGEESGSGRVGDPGGPRKRVRA